ncbi:MAG: hypothetical protein ACPGGK_01890 [Pikeienuella sp.]
MKFGTIIEGGKRTAIVQGTDGKARRLAEVCVAANLSSITTILELVDTGPAPLPAIASAIDTVAPCKATWIGHRLYPTHQKFWALPLTTKS